MSDHEHNEEGDARSRERKDSNPENSDRENVCRNPTPLFASRQRHTTHRLHLYSRETKLIINVCRTHSRMRTIPPLQNLHERRRWRGHGR